MAEKSEKLDRVELVPAPTFAPITTRHIRIFMGFIAVILAVIFGRGTGFTPILSAGYLFVFPIGVGIGVLFIENAVHQRSSWPIVATRTPKPGHSLGW